MPNGPIFRLLRLITVSASARIVRSRFGWRPLWTTSAAPEVERHPFIDVGDPDPDPSIERVEIIPALRTAFDVRLDQPTEHGCKSARLSVRVVDWLVRF